MPATAFDTLQATETLTAAGVQDAHARAIVLMMRDAVTEGVASKADVSDAIKYNLISTPYSAGVGNHINKHVFRCMMQLTVRGIIKIDKMLFCACAGKEML